MNQQDKQEPDHQPIQIEDLAVTQDRAEVVKGGVSTIPIKTYLCPSDPSPH